MMIRTSGLIRSFIMTKSTLALCCMALFLCRSIIPAQEEPTISEKQSQLIQAAENGDLPTVAALLQDNSIDVNCSSGAPLRMAAKGGHVEIISTLLAHPAIEPNMKYGGDHHSPLIVAVRNGQLNSITSLIADDRVDVNQPDSQGQTPLWLSIELYDKLNTTSFHLIDRIRENGIEPVRILIENTRTDVNMGKDALMRTSPLEVAIAAKWFEAIELLTQHPNIDVKKIEEEHFPRALRYFDRETGQEKEQYKKIANLLSKRVSKEKLRTLEELSKLTGFPSDLNRAIATLLYCQLR